ncbi:Protein-L-isoaspartate O-methyltransferase domain-containing protein 1 [Halotydeus destructor]|nr:Protein-L-isoaspartate O-methyltransferase domain-containing protein 1 [Halotydeus destructor]
MIQRDWLAETQGDSDTQDRRFDWSHLYQSWEAQYPPGEDNDELIDNLVDADYIKSHSVEAIFRAVDRGFYYVDGGKDTAYRDLAWKHGNLHISAPCIYSEVMEALKLESGLSFLNLGSGTGYLSTMAGLILGRYGVNHGVELCEDVVDYANKKLEQFKDTSASLYSYEFCEPQFAVGNCLCIDSGNKRLYDRIYCGAAVPPDNELDIQNLLRIGGILVMPCNDQLVQVIRRDVKRFDRQYLLPVSFANLVTHRPQDVTVTLPGVVLPSLKSICRSTINSVLRASVQKQLPVVSDKKEKRLKIARSRRHGRRARALLIPEEATNSSQSSSEDNVEQVLQDVDQLHQSMLRTVEAVRQIISPLSVSVRGTDAITSTSPRDDETVRSVDSGRGTDTDRRISTSSSSTSTSSSAPNCGAAVSERQSEDNDGTSNERSKRSFSVTDDDESVPEVNENGDASTRRVTRRDHLALRKRMHIAFQHSDTDSDDDDEKTDHKDETSDDKHSNSHRSDLFASLMVDRIKQLPLPLKLRIFVNNDRYFDD